ncbi:MAG: hypothetical protein J6W76_07755, partial [Spirochaetales bacterium]|nr:hypothetical protein [Spirochaetales bacterium]
KVKFNGDYLALEYKVNDADEWKTVTSKEFDAQIGDTVHIRKKSSGVEGKHGYVKESAEITLTVAAENIGKRAETEQGMEVEITNVSLKLTQTLDGNRIKVTAALENTSGIEYFGSLSYDYTWRVDGFIADNLNYAEVNNNVLYLDQSQMASGETYQVSAFVEIHYKTTIPKNDIVLMKEQKQLSVTVQ